MGKKRIGIVIAMDGEKEFVQQINNINKQSRLMQTELANVAKEFEGNANSMQALQARQQALSRVQAAYQQKLELANTGLNKAMENYRKQGERLKELEKQLTEAKEAQEEMKQAGDTSSEAYERQCREVGQLSDAVERQRLAQLRESGSVTDWNQRIAEAERQLQSTNREIERNTQYLQEAEGAADGCARSMDRFGNAAGESAGETVNWKEKIASAVATKGLSMAVDAVGELADKAKEAAEYVVDVGSSFEAGMSEVAAISNATGGDLDKLSEKAKQLGATTKFTATEAAGAFKYMSLAGWDTEKMLSGVDGVLNLAAASGMELAAASDMVTDYLSAFGMEAEKSAYMADMLAYAQANSNTTAEQLGEAYGNCAANLNAAGQDIETVTALLEGMANQGLKGSEAGTALGSIMTQITQKMEDGRIKIGETLVTVAGSKGNFRDMTDILKDVGKALSGMGTEERSAALAATFNKTALSGLNLILNEGMDEIEGYEEALRGADGAAEKMAETMQDNLAGDMTKAESALEGLGVAAYSYIEGPVRGVVQGVTNIINGITDAITPQKSELEAFVEEVGESNKKVSEMLGNARASRDQASGEMANLETYKEKLLELNNAMGKTEYQKYEMRTIISELADSIPQLAEAFDEETCNINLSSDAIASLIENQEAYLVQQAAVEARTEAMNALMEAELNVAKAEGAIKEAQDKLAEAQEKNKKSEGFLSGGYGDYYKEIAEYETALSKANKTLEEASELEEEAQEEYRLTSAAVDSAAEKAAEYAEKIKDIPGGAEEAADATGEFAAQAGEDMENVSVAAEEAAEAFENMKSSIADSIEGSVSMLEEFSGGTETTAEEIQKNLDSQIEGISKWSENMQVLAGAAGQGMSQELYDALAQMGPESANLVNTLVETLTSDMEQGTGEFGEICKKWQEAMQLQDESEVVASYTSLKDGIAKVMEDTAEDAGEASEKAQDNIKGGIEDGRPKVTGAAEETAVKASQAMQEKTQDFKAVGRDMMLAVAEGIKAGQQDVINASANAASAAVTGAQNKIGINSPSKVFRDKVGKQIPAGMALGIKGGQQDVAGAAASMAKAALANTQKELEIHSPSKAFRDKVGKQIPAGVTLGIKQAEGGAIKSAAEFAKAVYEEAAAQLEKLEKDNVGKIETTLADAEWYWDRMLKKSQKKGKEYYAQMKKLIKEEQEKIAQQRKAERFSSQEKALDAYKVYYDISPKAEMQYWDAARKKYKEGTQERLDADRNYYEAKENYYSKLKELEEDYANQCKEINEKLEEQTESLLDSYKSALSERKSAIKSAFGTFDAFLSESEGPEALLENMKSQAEGYAIWIQQLGGLERKGILGSGFLEELRAMGPEAAATVASLNMATEEQLKEMQQMWEAKDKMAQAQAEKETESLRQSTKEKIKAATQEAQAELNACQAEYEAAYAAITEGISGELKKLAADAYKSGNDAVASLVSAIRKKSKDKDTKKGVQESGKAIGQSMMDGMLAAMDNPKKIKASVEKVMESLEKEIKKQQTVSVELAGINAGAGILSLERMASAQVQQTANITVNNTGMAGMLGGMMAEIKAMREELRGMKVVLDTGALVGEISTGVGEELTLQAMREIGRGWDG